MLGGFSEIVTNMQDMFVSLVRDRRDMDGASLRKVSDGRIFTGSQALNNGLIDAIGGEAAAVTCLKQKIFKKTCLSYRLRCAKRAGWCARYLKT